MALIYSATCNQHIDSHKRRLTMRDAVLLKHLL